MSIFAQSKAIERLQDRLKSLESDVHDQDRAVRSLKLEYLELYDKVSRQMSRMAKRYAVDNPPHEALNDAPGVPDSVRSVDPVSAKILARRAKEALPE